MMQMGELVLRNMQLEDEVKAYRRFADLDAVRRVDLYLAGEPRTSVPRVPIASASRPMTIERMLDDAEHPHREKTRADQVSEVLAEASGPHGMSYEEVREGLRQKFGVDTTIDNVKQILSVMASRHKVERVSGERPYRHRLPVAGPR